MYLNKTIRIRRKNVQKVTWASELKHATADYRRKTLGNCKATIEFIFALVFIPAKKIIKEQHLYFAILI